jgi:hypothetical protein
MKLAVAATSAVLWLGLSTSAQAAQPSSTGGSTSAKVSTSGASSSGKASSSGPSSGYDWPDFVYGGNAISVMLPFQIAFVGYEPRVRLGLQYDRQLYKRHWVHIGVAALLDRGNHRTFKEDPCGREDVIGEKVCQAGSVAGFDGYLGYTYKFYLEDRPYIVPMVRAGAGAGFWKYPRIGGAQRQDLDKAWSLSGRLGGGLRVFLMRDLAVGLDLNLALGFTRQFISPAGEDLRKSSAFLFGMEVLPALEYRF